MTKNDIMGHWYKCEVCSKNIPMPDYIFINEDGEKTEKYDFCPFCETGQSFKSSDAKKPCTKKEALLRFKIEKQIKDRIIRFESYWE